MVFIISRFFSSRNHPCRNYLVGNNGEPIYIHEPNGSEGDEGNDKAVDSTEVVVAYKKHHNDKIVVDR